MIVPRTTAAFTFSPTSWDFAILCLLVPESSAFYAVPVRRLARLSPDFLQTAPRETALVVWTRGFP